MEAGGLLVFDPHPPIHDYLRSILVSRSKALWPLENKMPGPGNDLVGNEELQEVMDVMESGHLFRYGDLEDPSYRHKVYTLEKEFARYCGAKYALATGA